MEGKPTTLMAREESKGRTYPLFIERLLFLGAIVAFFFVQPMVMDPIESTVLSALAGWCGLPILLMFTTELIGRVMQRLISN